MTHYRIFCPVYNQIIWLFVGKREVVNLWFQKRGMPNALNPDWAMEAGRIDFKNTARKDFYLWIGEFKANIGNVAGITHEVFHVVSMLLKNAGMKHTEHSEEAYAYLFGWLTSEILDRVFKGAKHG